MNISIAEQGYQSLSRSNLIRIRQFYQQHAMRLSRGLGVRV